LIYVLPIKGGERVSKNINGDTVKLILAVFVAIAGIVVKIITYSEKQGKEDKD
jgi:hypothetical protein